MSAERPTPETDAARAELQRSLWTTGPKASVQSVQLDFARKLERERDEAREQRDRLVNALKTISYYAPDKSCGYDLAQTAKDALAAVKGGTQ